jgi:signal transduction histidine kinase
LRFQEKNIAVYEHYPSRDEPPIIVNGDRGLLSQVIANFFSNALKYTRANPGASGLHMWCAVEKIPEYFSVGQDGVMVSVCTSGPEINNEESANLFSEHFRASNTESEHGTGHGLHFIRTIIERHGGKSGYKRTENGNLFYIVLPCLAPDQKEGRPS